MFIASFTRAGTFLLVGEDVVVDGKRGHAFGKDGHKQLIKTGHQGNGSEVAGV